MKSGYKASSPYEFTRAAHDELRDAEMNLRMVADLGLSTTGQRGVWRLSVAMTAIEAPVSAGVACRWEGTWPNARVQTFEAFMYSAIHRCVRMAEEYRRDEEKHAAGQENRR